MSDYAHNLKNCPQKETLEQTSFDLEAKKRAETTNTSPQRQRVVLQNVSGKALLAAGDGHQEEIEAIGTLYSRPYAAGLRYGQVKELARRLSIKPFHIDESQPQTLLRLWQAFGTVAPDKVDTGSGKHCKHIVDLVSLVGHAIDERFPSEFIISSHFLWEYSRISTHSTQATMTKWANSRSAFGRSRGTMDFARLPRAEERTSSTH